MFFSKKHQKIVARPFSPVLPCSKIGRPSCFSPVLLYGGGYKDVRYFLSPIQLFRLKCVAQVFPNVFPKNHGGSLWTEMPPPQNDLEPRK